MRKNSFLLIVIVLSIAGYSTLNSCTPSIKNTPLKIALSSGSENYVNWVYRGDSLAEIIDMRGMQKDSAIALLSTCDAIIFTGGEDVSPAYYNNAYDSARCETNPDRDTLEFSLIQEAMRLKIPIFGVCRGLQILNVSLGGTLIIDIPSDHKGDVIHRCEDYTQCFHNVNVVRGSQLYDLSKADSGVVTTNHHQAIEKLAPNIHVMAWGNDSIAEAIGWENPNEKPFLMAVQWHPERMDTISPLSMPLMNAFLKAANNYKKSKQ